MGSGFVYLLIDSPSIHFDSEPSTGLGEGRGIERKWERNPLIYIKLRGLINSVMLLSTLLY